jgi:hypothetical protein
LQAIAVSTSDDTATVSTGNAEMVLSVTETTQISPSTAEVIVAEDSPEMQKPCFVTSWLSGSRGDRFPVTLN